MSAGSQIVHEIFVYNCKMSLEIILLAILWRKIDSKIDIIRY